MMIFSKMFVCTFGTFGIFLLIALKSPMESRYKDFAFSIGLSSLSLTGLIEGAFERFVIKGRQ